MLKTKYYTIYITSSISFEVFNIHVSESNYCLYVKQYNNCRVSSMTPILDV